MAKANKNKKKSPEECQFEADGVRYGFRYPTIKVKLDKGGYEVLSCEDALQREDVLSNLVSKNSGAIIKIGEADESGEKSIEELNKKEIVSQLEALEVEFDPKAKVDDLREVLREHLNESDNVE